MTNPFYEPGEHRALKVKELFGRIAPCYDFINDLQSFGLHRYWKWKVIKLAEPAPSKTALDVCCGTGDLALALARKCGRVVGLDFSDRMLRVALTRQQKSCVPDTCIDRLQFVQGDALHLPFADRSFDIVTVAYGLRNLADLKSGIAEMSRIARPGARLVVLDFGKPDNRTWRAAYFAYLRLFVPVLGKIFCGSASAYSYILESLKHYPAQRGVAAHMIELGLTNVRIVNILGGIMSINLAEVGR